MSGPCQENKRWVGTWMSLSAAYSVAKDMLVEGAKILPRCTADLTDVRMAGSTDSVMVSGEDFLLERCSTDLKRYPRPWHIENCEGRLDEESGRPYLIERIIGL